MLVPSTPVVHLELHTGDLQRAQAFYVAAVRLASRPRRHPPRLVPHARAGRRPRRRHRRVRDQPPAVAALRRGRPRSARPPSARATSAPPSCSRPARARPAGAASSPRRPAARSPSGRPSDEAARSGAARLLSVYLRLRDLAARRRRVEEHLPHRGNALAQLAVDLARGALDLVGAEAVGQVDRARRPAGDRATSAMVSSSSTRSTAGWASMISVIALRSSGVAASPMSSVFVSRPRATATTASSTPIKTDARPS